MPRPPRRVWASLEIDEGGTLRLRITGSTLRRPGDEELLTIDQDGQRAIGERRLAENIGGYLLSAIARPV